MKQKIIFFLLAFLALCLISADSCPTRLVHLTVINKSGKKIELSMTGKVHEEFYYLHIAEGSQQEPYPQDFTGIADSYSSSLYYFEYWDPVYGHQCGTKGQTLDVSHSVRLVVLPCKVTPPNGGEPPRIIKYGGQNQRNPRNQPR
jgi:hypothetical protein